MRRPVLVAGVLLLFLLAWEITGTGFFPAPKAKALQLPFFTKKEIPARSLEKLGLHIKTDRRVYAAGQPVAVSFLLLNTSGAEVRLRFNTGQVFDLELRQEGRLVWKWSADKLFTQAVTEKSLAPGEFMHEVLLIAPEVTSGLETGEYELTVEITAVQLRGYTESLRLEFR